jgi:hypothetical protein
MVYDIFVSYRRTDRELVAKVVSRLEQRGVSTWYDADIEGGADWRETIVEALTQSGMLVVFFSDACNGSRQLKKELAVADSLEKPVVPILIEDTQPKGAYLYELADRNWIQAWPDAASKVEELVDLLAGLAGKAKSVAPPAPAAAAETAATPIAANDLGAVSPAPARLSDAYVGRVGQKKKGKRAPKRDILPFGWIDLLVILAGVAALFFGVTSDNRFTPEEMPRSLANLGLIAVTLAALFGAVVFPVRYYLRRRSAGSAAMSYVISAVILYAVFMGLYATLYATLKVDSFQSPARVAAEAATVWGVFAVIAFLIYGVLAGQRAVRAFRSNIKKI